MKVYSQQLIASDVMSIHSPHSMPNLIPNDRRPVHTGNLAGLLAANQQ